MTVPFADARRPEVLTRVVYQLVVIKQRQLAPAEASPGQVISAVIRDLNVLQLADLRLFATSMYWSCVTCRRKSREWRREAIVRSRAGENFRSVAYTGYKATRRDPRVTNRGVGSAVASYRAAGLLDDGTAMRDEDGND